MNKQRELDDQLSESEENQKLKTELIESAVQTNNEGDVFVGGRHVEQALEHGWRWC